MVPLPYGTTVGRPSLADLGSQQRVWVGVDLGHALDELQVVIAVPRFIKAELLIELVRLKIGQQVHPPAQ